jgi:hypothetical protein
VSSSRPHAKGTRSCAKKALTRKTRGKDETPKILSATATRHTYRAAISIYAGAAPLLMAFFDCLLSIFFAADAASLLNPLVFF